MPGRGPGFGGTSYGSLSRVASCRATSSVFMLCSFIIGFLVSLHPTVTVTHRVPVTRGHGPPARDGATDPYEGGSVTVAPRAKSATANLPLPSDPVFTI